MRHLWLVCSHDIEKVILNQYFHTEFIQIMNRTSSGMTLDEAEKEVIENQPLRMEPGWLKNGIFPG